MALLHSPGACAAEAGPDPGPERARPARAVETFDAPDHGLVADCSTDNSGALAALLARAATASAAAGGQSEVRIPAASACYGFLSVVTVPARVRVTGLGRPMLAALGRTGALLRIKDASNVTLSGLRLDSRSAAHPTIAMPVSVSGASGVRLEEIELVNPTGEIHVTDSDNVTILSPVVTGSLLHGVLFSGVRDSAVVGGRFQNEVGFGIILKGGSHGNLVQGNRTTANGIELVGVTEDSSGNRIIGNHAEGAGDNCISISGSENIVQGNLAQGCQGNGIEVFGDRNLVVGNTARNNARGHAAQSGWRAGIAIQGGFGGVAQYNVVRGNIVDDDQAIPTQLYGIWLGRHMYQVWASGQPVPAGTYRYHGPNLYQAAVAGVTGTRPPDGREAANDGGVTWRWIRSPADGTPLSDGNEVSGNVIARYGLGRCHDSSGGTHNQVVCRSGTPVPH